MKIKTEMRMTKQLPKIGIHQINDQAGAMPRRSCFFVRRPFGNYLIYPRHLDDIPNDFFQHYGGVYKQIDTDFIESRQAEIMFERYGASFLSPTEGFHQKIRREKFPCEFVDTDLEIKPFGIAIKQEVEEIFFLHPSMEMKGDKFAFFQSRVDTPYEQDDFFDYLGGKEFDRIFASAY